MEWTHITGGRKLLRVHDYRRLVEAELDARSWKPAELERASGLSRQLIWGILHDNRQHLGQMPKDTTLEGLARGFGIPVERVRTAAARSLVGYAGDNAPLIADLTQVSIDVLLTEIRRRVVGNDSQGWPPQWHPGDEWDSERVPRAGQG